MRRWTYGYWHRGDWEVIYALTQWMFGVSWYREYQRRDRPLNVNLFLGPLRICFRKPVACESYS